MHPCGATQIAHCPGVQSNWFYTAPPPLNQRGSSLCISPCLPSCHRALQHSSGSSSSTETGTEREPSSSKSPAITLPTAVLVQHWCKPPPLHKPPGKALLCNLSSRWRDFILHPQHQLQSQFTQGGCFLKGFISLSPVFQQCLQSPWLDVSDA